MSPMKLSDCVGEARGIVEVVAKSWLDLGHAESSALEGATTILSFVELMLEDLPEQPGASVPPISRAGSRATYSAPPEPPLRPEMLSPQRLRRALDNASNVMGSTDELLGFIMDTHQDDGPLSQALLGVKTLTRVARDIVNGHDRSPRI